VGRDAGEGEEGKGAGMDELGKTRAKRGAFRINEKEQNVQERMGRGGYHTGENNRRSKGRDGNAKKWEQHVNREGIQRNHIRVVGEGMVKGKGREGERAERIMWDDAS